MQKMLQYCNLIFQLLGQLPREEKTNGENFL